MAGWLFKAKEAREPKRSSSGTRGTSGTRATSGTRSTSGSRQPASADGYGGGASNTAVRAP
jgi:hypothetical protein